MRWWLLAFGEQVTVGPPRLRERMRNTVAGMAAGYGLARLRPHDAGMTLDGTSN